MIKAILMRVALFFILLINIQIVRAQVWQMPVGYDNQNLHTQMAYYFAQEVARESGGELTLQVQPGGQLFKSEQIFGAVRRDLVPIGGRLLSGMGIEDPLFELDAMPFLATNYTQALKLYSAIKPELEKRLLGKGVKLLYTVPWPAQGLYSSVEVESAEDFSDLRFRPYSALTAKFGEQLGAQTVVVPMAKLARQLKKKRLDLMFGSAAVAAQFDLSKSLPYWYALSAWLPKEVVVVNLKRFEALSVEQQQLVVAARNTESRGWLRSKQAAERARAQLAGLGVLEIEPSAALQQQLKNAAAALTADWLARTGDIGRYILERYEQSL